MSGFLIINPRSGTGRTNASDLRKEAERLGIETHVLDEGDDLAALARDADPPLGMAGGDGSLAKSNLVPGTYTCVIIIDP